MGQPIKVGSRSGLEKAALGIAEGTVSGKQKITFTFNPENCTVKGGARWEFPAAKAAKESPPPHYGGPEHVTLSLNALFDDSEKSNGDVSGDVETLLSWTRPTSETLGAGKVPWGPLLNFTWGNNKTFAQFKCVLTSVSAQYTMFLRDGTPIRAMVSLTLQQVPDNFKRQNPTSGAIHGRRAHTVAEGDSLQSIAFTEYGDPNFWRALARFNGLDDPFEMEPGTSLLIPSRPEAQELAAV